MINSKNYNDIIDLPHHESKTHKHMSINDRAAQFSPFAALVGYEDVIHETARKTENKIELSENQMAILNEKLLLLSECKIKPQIALTYFQKDKRKTGGKYITIEGIVKRFDSTNKAIIMQDGTTIKIDDVFDIRSEAFNNFDLV
ncbi:MAG: hypothetical protein J1F32_04655 [Erysipelotrichales bacterium]|nr:hypothetical protein [Erysipelotrichales bacterium]